MPGAKLIQQRRSEASVYSSWRVPIGRMLKTHNSSSAITRVDILAYCLIGILAFFHFFANLRIEDYSSDSSLYIGLSRSILEKCAYEFNFESHTHFPPGFPLILAGLSWVFGNHYVVFIRALAVIGMLALLASYHLLCRTENKAFALVACLIVGTSGYYFQAVTQVVGSDVPYFFASTLALLLAMKLSVAQNRLERVVVLFGLLICLILSVLIRTVGVSLLVGMGAWLVLKLVFRRNDALYCLKTFVPVLMSGALVLTVWIMWSQHAKSEIENRGGRARTYIDNFWAKDPHQPELGRATVSDLLFRVGDNLVIHAAHIAEMLTRVPWVQKLWYSPFVLSVLVLISLGWARSLGAGNREGFAPWYFSAYVFVYLCWPFDEGSRFMLPAVILALLYFWRGTRFFKSALMRRPKAFLRWGSLVCGCLAIYATIEVFLSPSPSGLQPKLIAFFWFMATLATAVGSGAFNNLALRATSSLQCWFAGILARSISPICAAALIVLGLATQLVMAVDNVNATPETYVHYPSTQAATWISRHVSPHDVVMAQQISLIHRITGRRVVSFPISSNPHRIMDEIRKKQVKFLVVNTSSQMTYYRPTEAERINLLQDSYSAALELVHRERSLQIFKIRV